MNQVSTPPAASFATIEPGARIAIMVGGGCHVHVVGVVQSVTGARFKVQFPAAPEAAINEPFNMTFRKVDGRSVGGRYRKCAQLVATASQ